MDRRRFVLTSLASVLAAPLVAEAQSADRIPRIGFLFFGAPGPPVEVEVDAFRQGLRERGYVERQNVALEIRAASSKIGSRVTVPEPGGRRIWADSIPPTREQTKSGN